MNAEALEGLDNHLDYNRWITSLARYRALMGQKGDKLTNKDVSILIYKCKLVFFNVWYMAYGLTSLLLSII
jgi:hypothetical protein